MADCIDHTPFLDDLIDTPHLHYQQPTAPPAMSWSRPSHHASSSISSITSSTRSLGQVWDEQDLELMLHSDDGSMSLFSPSHSDLEIGPHLDIDHISLTGYRSMAPSPSPALPCTESLSSYFIGACAAPEIDLTADFSGMHIPLSAPASRQYAELTGQGHHFLEPTITSRPLPLLITAASTSSSLTPMSIPATTMLLPLHHPQRLYFQQGLTAAQIPASSPSSFHNSSAMNLSIAKPNQQASTFLNSPLLIASAFPSSTPSTLANFNTTGAFPSIPNYLDSNDNSIDVNSSMYLSDLSSLAQQQQRQLQLHQQQQQQQQQQQRLIDAMTLASSPLAALPIQPQPHPLTYHTTTIPHTNRDTLHNTTTTSMATTTFLRPVSAINFAQATADHFSDSSTGAGPLLPMDTVAFQKRRRGRPPLDRMSSITSLSPPPSHSTITSTSNNNSSSKALSRSSSTSSSTSSSSSRTTATTTTSTTTTTAVTTPSRSRQPSPQNFFIMPPYQHSDKKLDHRSFNSRKILKQAQARQTEAEAEAQAEAKVRKRERERDEQEKLIKINITCPPFT